MGWKERKMKPFILGALTACVVVMALLAVSVAYDGLVANKVPYSQEVVVSEKLCNDDILGYNVSKIRATDGIAYFVQSDDCMEIEIGKTVAIHYNHICNGANKNFCFNRSFAITRFWGSQ